MSHLDKRVSFFDSCRQTKPRTNAGTFWQIVTSEKLRAEYWRTLEQIRSEPDKAKRRALKQTLPAFTPSGTFSTRSAAGLLCHSGLLSFDLDNLEDAEQAKKDVFKLPFVAYAAVSASGNGLWGCVPISNPEAHQAHFEALQSRFDGIGYTIDESGRDVTRLRFWSYDPDPLVRHDAQVFTEREEKVKCFVLPGERREAPAEHHAPARRQPNDLDKLQAIVEQVNAQGIDITGQYYTWIGIGYALAKELGESGREYFHQISQHSPKYKFEDAQRQYDACLKYGATQRFSLATIFYHAKLNGVRYFEGA